MYIVKLYGFYDVEDISAVIWEDGKLYDVQEHLENGIESDNAFSLLDDLAHGCQLWDHYNEIPDNQYRTMQVAAKEAGDYCFATIEEDNKGGWSLTICNAEILTDSQKKLLGLNWKSES